MAYETGTALDFEDLLSKLDTFATGLTTDPWVSGYTPNPDTTNRWFELHKTGHSFSMRYPASMAAGETASVHHASAYINSSTEPGAHTSDSGNGYNVGTGGTSANLETERCVSEIGNGPFSQYHFFADDTTFDYVHVVVEITAGVFRHFGFGHLDKFGDNWVGGQYVYGHYHDQATNRTAVSTQHTTMLDGLYSATNGIRGATVRLTSGLPNQSTSVWGVCVATSSLGTDTAALARQKIHGGFRAGMEARGFGSPVGNFSSGVIPMYSFAAYYKDPSNSRVYLLGYQPDVRAVSCFNFSPGDEITIGVDTWIIFPMALRTEANVANRTYYAGLAYRKFT